MCKSDKIQRNNGITLPAPGGRNRRRYTLCVALLLVSCTEEADDPDGARGSSRSAEITPVETDVDEVRIAELGSIIRDRERSPEERRLALIERARLTGKEIPATLADPPDRGPRVEITLPEGPPVAAEVTSGQYLLSLSIEYDNGFRHDDRIVSEVKVEGQTVEIRMQRPGTESIRGTLEHGVFNARGSEGEAEFQLRGQIVGQDKLAGTMTGGAASLGLAIVDGRWSLEKIK